MLVQREDAGGVATLTLDRPEKLNAISVPLMVELRARIDELARDDGVACVIHFDPPEDHKAYLHRSGRTARAGGSGVAVTLVLWNQELEVKRMQKRLALDIPIVEMFSNDRMMTSKDCSFPCFERAS